MPQLRVHVGIDLVSIERMRALLREPSFATRVFQPSELIVCEPAHLAGIYAAKEALFKAIAKPERLTSVVVIHDEAGHPKLECAPDVLPPGLASLDVSISHEGDMACAVVVALVTEVPAMIAEELGE